jgi:phenylalanyl-tRNA synthetase beta chain
MRNFITRSNQVRKNPISVEQTMCREQLVTGLLSTLRVNTTREMPQQIFEAGDCFELSVEMETGVRTRRKLAAGIAGPRVGYTDAKQALDALSRELGLGLRFVGMDKDKSAPFIGGRCAVVFTSPAQSATYNLRSEIPWGMLGEVHPEVLGRFGITQPTVLFEVDLSVLL